MASSILDDLYEGLERLCDKYQTKQIDEVTFQKKAAIAAAKWAAYDIEFMVSIDIKSVKEAAEELRVDDLGGIPLQFVNIVPQILVDVVEKQQEEWKPMERM